MGLTALVMRRHRLTASAASCGRLIRTHTSMYVYLLVLPLDQGDQITAQKHLHLCVAVLEELVGCDV